MIPMPEVQRQPSSMIFRHPPIVKANHKNKSLSMTLVVVVGTPRLAADAGFFMEQRSAHGVGTYARGTMTAKFSSMIFHHPPFV